MARKIAIIGAGPAGLTLGRLLHLQGIDFTIFESEPSTAVRSQGGTLDLHPGTGLEAVRKAGLMAEFEKHARYDGDTFTLCDGQLNIHAQHVSDGHGDRPEIDRKDLRDILLASVPAEHVKWDKKLVNISYPTLHFSDNTTYEADLIVGADGGWSRIRAQLSETLPQWTGASYFSLRVTENLPELYKLVNRGSVFSISEGLCLSVQYMGDGSLTVYAFFQPDSEDWVKNHGKHPDELDEWYGSWNPLLRSAYQHANLVFAKNLYMLPVGFRWDSKPGMTLIGDSAHLFTPFAGEGVNTGMADALDLAEVISRGGSITEYEEKKFTRTRQTSLLTWQNTLDTLSKGDSEVATKGIGRRLMCGVPDETTVVEEKVLNKYLLKIHELNIYD